MQAEALETFLGDDEGAACLAKFDQSDVHFFFKAEETPDLCMAHS